MLEFNNNVKVNVRKLVKVNNSDIDLSKFILLPGTEINYTECAEDCLEINTLSNLEFSKTPSWDSIIPFIVSQLIIDCDLHEKRVNAKLEKINKVSIVEVEKFKINITIEYNSTEAAKETTKDLLYEVELDGARLNTAMGSNERGNDYYVGSVKPRHNGFPQYNEGLRHDNNGFRTDNWGYGNDNNNQENSIRNMTFGEALNTAQSKISEYTSKAEQFLNESLDKVQGHLSSNNQNVTENNQNTDMQMRNTDGLGAVIPGSNLSESLKEACACNNACTDCNCEKENNKVNLSK